MPAVRLVPFQFNVSQAYILEFGERYIRFFKNYTQILDGFGNPYELETPYLGKDLFELDVNTQSADTIYIFHPDYEPRKLLRNGDADWTLTIMTGGGEFASPHFPGCGTFHEQRMWYGGFNDNPLEIQASAVGDYENMVNDPTDPSSAIDFLLVSGSVDKARWMFSGGDHLLVGTGGGVWKVRSTLTGEAISQENVNFERVVTVGTCEIPPVMVEDSILFVTRMKTTIRKIAYSLEADRMITPSLMRIASHITYGSNAAESGVVQMAFQKEPFPILWVVRKDGQLLGMTYDVQDRVYAWFRVVTDGRFESVAVISADGVEDEVWVAVSRVISGVEKRYLECFTPINFYSNIVNGYFVHSGITTTGGPTITGLDHLKGRSVVALVDGVAYGPFRVSINGTINIGVTGTVIHVGLPYTSKFEPMKLHTQTEQGTSRSKKQKINRVTLCLYKTGLGVKVGPDADKLRNLFSNEIAGGELFTGDINYEFEGDWSNEATIHVEQSQPLPMTVRGLIPRYSTEDE